MELRSYQLDIVAKGTAILSRFKLLYLAMEVRTGKTLTSLFICDKIGVKNVLFVTKKKAIPSIQADFDKCKFSYNLTLVNFEQLHNVVSSFDIVIIDEAHSLGAFPNPSNRAKELRKICVNTPVIFLSGTPTPESYSQLFHQLYVSSWSPFDQYKNFYHWAKDYVTISQRKINGYMINDYKNADFNKVMENLNQFFIFFSQKDAGFENVVTEVTLYVPLSVTQKHIIGKLQKDGICKGQKNNIIADTGAKLVSKVHQICSGTIKHEDGTSSILDKSKALFIKDYFVGKKIAIIYKFQAEYDLLYNVFGDSVYLGQIQSVREGTNLSQYDALVMYNIDYSATSYWQGRDRMTSKDRTAPNTVYWIFSKGGIEDQIYKVVKNKKDFTTKYYERIETSNENC